MKILCCHGRTCDSLELPPHNRNELREYENAYEIRYGCGLIAHDRSRTQTGSFDGIDKTCLTCFVYILNNETKDFYEAKA